MKKIILQALLAIIIILAVIDLAIPTDKLGTLLATSFPSATHERMMPPDFYACEDALQDGNLTEARTIIESGKTASKDSDNYYRYVVLETKYYFTTMQADSFLKYHRLTRQYVNKHLDHPNKQQRIFRMECEMQSGVYETKMNGRMDSALTHYQNALTLMDGLPRDDSYRLMAFSNIADTYKQMGRYDQSVNYFRQALELGDSIQMADNVRATLSIGIASAYAAMGSFEQSVEWWEKARELKPAMGRTEMFHYLNNRGNDYYLQGRYQESLDCFLELDSLISADSTMVWERMFEWANLSDLYIKLGQPERAIPLLNQTEPFFTQQRQLIPLFYLITQRIELALINHRYDEAQQLINDNPVPYWMIPEQKQIRRKVVMEFYRQTRQWQQCAEVMNDYALLSDSIANGNLKMRFSDVLLQYEHQKQLLDQQKQLEKKELSFRWAVALLIASIILIILIAIISVMKYRERKLRDAELRGSIAELRMATVRNRITPHFISNALTAELMAQMNGQKPNLDQLVLLLHRGIELTDIEQTTLSEELKFIHFYCDIESRSLGPDFQLNINIDKEINTDKVLLPSMSVQILVENAIKHGLKARQPEEGRPRTVWINVLPREEATLIEVIDNGVGLAEDRRNKERTGLRVMRQSIHLLNEQFIQEHGKHTGKPLMDYGLENYSHPDGQRGCRAWLLLPADFSYILRKLKENP